MNLLQNNYLFYRKKEQSIHCLQTESFLALCLSYTSGNTRTFYLQKDHLDATTHRRSSQKNPKAFALPWPWLSSKRAPKKDMQMHLKYTYLQPVKSLSTIQVHSFLYLLNPSHLNRIARCYQRDSQDVLPFFFLYYKDEYLSICVDEIINYVFNNRYQQSSEEYFNQSHK